MTNIPPQPWEGTPRLLRFDTPSVEGANEGPVALLRSMGVLALQHKFKLTLCAALGISLGLLYAQSLPRVYTATATLLLEPRRQAAVSGQDGNSQSLDPNRADSELQIIRSERLLNMVFDSLNLNQVPELGPQPPRPADPVISNVKKYLTKSFQQLSPSLFKKWNGADVPAKPVSVGPELEAKAKLDARQAAFLNFTRHIEARRVGQAYVIEIDYSSSDPALTATVANAAASAYILQSVAFKSQMAISGTEALQWRLDALAAQVDAATNGVKHGTLPAIATPDADARVIGAALPPLNPSGPHTSLIVALGGIIGLSGGFAIIALNIVFDRRVRNAKDLARETGIACFGSLPDAGTRSGNASRFESDKAAVVIRQPGSAYATAVRDLRTSIEIACSSVRSQRSVVVAIASWDASSGASAICLSLAQLISHSGRNVTLFKSDSAEVRNRQGDGEPSMAETLADVLIADIPTEKVVFQQGNSEGISVLPIHSRNPESNLFANFRDRRVSRIVEAARNTSDVLLDLPPLAKSTDALALASHADVVVLVVTAGKTTFDEASDTLQKLRRAGANVIGTVINTAKA